MKIVSIQECNSMKLWIGYASMDYFVPQKYWNDSNSDLVKKYEKRAQPVV